MTPDLSETDKAKLACAKHAAQAVETGMRVGLGTGSTAAWLVRCLGVRMRDEGLRIKAVPTSTQTAELARDLGIDVITLDDAGLLDLTIDGADEFDRDLNLIKGGGGALLQEKIVATASEQMIVIADTAKEVDRLGAFPLPIEVIAFGLKSTQKQVEDLLVSMDVAGRTTSLRVKEGAPFVTDEGNHILDLHLNSIADARQLAQALNQIPGVVENGLFIDICDRVIIGAGDGTVISRDLKTSMVETAQVDVTDVDALFAKPAV